MAANMRTLVCIGLIFIAGCGATDSEHVPFALSGLGVWVFERSTKASHFAGQIEASYLGRREALSRCASQASAFASSRQMRDWDYVCCTATSTSDCVTKVR